MFRVSVIIALISSTFAQEPAPCENKFEYVYNVIEKLVGLGNGNLKQDSKIEQLETKLEDALTTIDALKSAQTNIQSSPVGSTYVRWGKSTCPVGAQKVYDGYAGGAHSNHSGTGANIICLPSDPVWGSYHDAIALQSTINGVDYKMGKWLNDHEAPCVVCMIPRAISLMIPARSLCYDGWKLEYSGYLASTKWDDHRAEYICLDEHYEANDGPLNLKNNGVLLYHVEARCGSLPCEVYPHGREVTCAMCSYSPASSNHDPNV